MMTAESIESLLNGSVQLLITSVPITGNFFVSARQLSITALFDLQKDQHKVPYLRIATCDKAKELITSTICETISDTIRERVNLVLRRMPRAISVAKIISSFVSSDSDDRSPSAALLQAFRAKMMKVRLGPNSAMFGQMLRTTCGPDEVCLSDFVKVSLSIPTLALRGDAFDFFGLSPQTVESFLNTVRNAIQNTAGKALSSGVSLVGLERHLCPYGISQPGIQLLDDGLVLLNAELDAYVLMFDGGGIGTQQKQQKRRHCSPTEL